MEIEIEEALKDIYKNIKIEVKYVDIRQYEIKVKINHQTLEYESKIMFQYNANYTFDINIKNIVNIIDNEIIISFYKKKA